MQNKYLEVLNLTPGASKTEIKSAFRKLSKLYHPDLNKNENAVEKFLEIHEAYKFLTEVGPKPNNEPVSYDYDSQKAAYSDRRRRAREYASRKAREAKRQQELQLRLILKYFNYYAAFCLLFNVLIAVDYFLPRKQFTDKVVSSHNQSYIPDESVYPAIRHSNKIVMENFNLNFDHNESKKIYDVQEALVVTTWLFETPLYAIFEVRQEPKRLDQAYNLYKVFGYLIPASLLVLSLYFYFIENPDHKISLALLLILFSSIQLFLFIKY